MTRALTSALGLRARRAPGRRRSRHGLCVASGWQLRHACTDGLGHGVCPVCAQPVRMRSDAGPACRAPGRGRGAWVVEAHRAA